MVDVIESIKKLDVQPNNILVMRISPQANNMEIQQTMGQLQEWLMDNDLETVQIFLVTGQEFDVNMMTNSDMNQSGWYRKDDL